MSADHKSQHKLAAILFADIQGYTSLMQKGESKAMSILSRYEEITQAKVNQFSGEVIKKYGDGSLILFDSTVDAVQCAIEMQQEFQQEPVVPLRIGVHVGEVIRKGNDVFGNGINIASRVESMGAAGAVLISKDAQKRVKNQEHHDFVSLGQFNFKNVEEPIEVFALANQGLVVPTSDQMSGKLNASNISSSNRFNRVIPILLAILALGAISAWVGSENGWFDGISSNQSPLTEEIRERRVAVMVFENQTMDDQMDVFGIMASDFITQALMEHSNAKVVSAANANNNVQMATIGRIDFAKETGAEVIVQGRYYMRENNLLLHANIMEAASGEIIHALQPIEGSKDNPMALLDELQQELLGYWILKDEKWVGKNPPKFNSYQEYLKALDYWQLDQKKTEEHLLKAFEYDSTYYRPLLKLAVNYLNFGERELADTTLQFLSSKDPDLSPFERMRLKGVRARLIGGRAAMEEEAAVYLKMHEEYNIFGVNAVQEFRSLGRWQDCISTFERFYSLDQVRSGWVSSIYFGDYLYALFKLGQYDNVIQKMDSVDFKLEFFVAPLIHLKTLVRLNQMSEVDRYLKLYSSQKYMGFRGKPVHPSLFYLRVCQELFLMHKEDLIEKYVNDMPEIQPNDYENYQVFPGGPFTISFFKEDYHATYKEYKSELIANGRYVERIILLSKLGRRDEALSLLDEMEGLANDDFLNIYEKAAAMLALGDKEKATELAIESHEKGMNFFPASFTEDWRFRDLQGFGPFEEFVQLK